MAQGNETAAFGKAIWRGRSRVARTNSIGGRNNADGRARVAVGVGENAYSPTRVRCGVGSDRAIDERCIPVSFIEKTTSPLRRVAANRGVDQSELAITDLVGDTTANGRRIVGD